MATVNVTTANTFEEWRVKTNEIGTAVGDLSDLTIADSSAATIVAALNIHDTATEAATAAIGVIGNLWDTTNYADLVLAANKNQADIVTIAATAGIDIAGSSLAGYNGSETALVAILNAQRAVDITQTSNISTNATGVASRLTEIGTIGSLATSASNLVAAINEIHTETNTNTSGLAGIGAAYVAVVGDTMTGTLITPSSGLSGSTAGLSAATLLTLGTGSGTAIKINSSQRVGFGTAAHASHKVDVNGNLNATSLSYAGVDLSTKFILAGEVFEDTVGAMFTGNAESGGISAVYNDASGNVDLAIANNGHTHTTGNVTGLDSQIKTVVGAMFGGNTESGIVVDYQSGDGTIDLNVLDPTVTLTGAVTGSATMTNLGSITIATTSGAGNIITADIANLAVTNAKLGNDSVNGAKIANDSINSEHYVNGSIDNAHIADNAINSEHYAADSIDREHIANDAVGSAELRSLSTFKLYNSGGTVVKTLYGAGA